jgi:hypothetical protein
MLENLNLAFLSNIKIMKNQKNKIDFFSISLFKNCQILFQRNKISCVIC